MFPRERMLEVAEHYYHFDGRSPINDQNRALIEALQTSREMPIYWGNRNWHPLLADTMRQMRDDGIKRAVAFVTSAFGSYSGCRQYIEDIERARGEATDAIESKIRPFSAHPKFIQAMTDRVRTALAELPQGRLVFTAHSVPVSMAESSPYVRELEQACAAVAQGVGRDDWKLVYQSRSGPPGQPWLEPDIGAVLTRDSFRRGDRAHRVPFRSHGSALRSGYRGAGAVRGIGREDGPRRDRGDASGDDRDDRGDGRAGARAVRGGMLRGSSAGRAVSR